MPFQEILNTSESKRLSRGELAALLLLAFCFWLQAWTASKNLPPVADEIAHVTGGESYWRYGVNHLQPENGYMAMHWATMPLRLHPPVFPDVPSDLSASFAMVLTGHRLFYESGNDPAAMLAAGRAMMAIVGSALILLIGWWGRTLWGPAGGLLAAGLATFSPTLLAHAGLIMSDLTTSFFLLLTLTVWWQLFQKISLPRIFICGVCSGLLLLSKMSGVLGLPMIGVLALIRLSARDPMAWHFFRPRTPASGSRKFALVVAASALGAMVAGLTLWTAFGFRFSMFANPAAPAPHQEVTWEMLLSDGGIATRTVGTLRAWRLLPEAWLHGFAETVHFLPGRMAFLNGETNNTGWLVYFPYAWLVKTPLSLFALIALGLAAIASPRAGTGKPPAESSARTRRFVYSAAPLIVLFVVYWAFALSTRINIGHRHLLPIYAPMFIAAGGTAQLLVTGSRVTRGLVAALIIWFVAESLYTRPSYISYFNLLAGGPRNGYRHLVDSNVDVGQDLIALERWLEAEAKRRGGSERVFLSFFGPSDPKSYGIVATRFADNGFDARPRTYPAKVGGGLYCISVTLFQGLYTLSAGPWTAERERVYQHLTTLLSTRSPTIEQAIAVEHLQFGRLRYFLAAREPDARIGYSILVFRLTDNEVAQALYAPISGNLPEM